MRLMKEQWNRRMESVIVSASDGASRSADSFATYVQIGRAKAKFRI